MSSNTSRNPQTHTSTVPTVQAVPNTNSNSRTSNTLALFGANPQASTGRHITRLVTTNLQNPRITQIAARTIDTFNTANRAGRDEIARDLIIGGTALLPVISTMISDNNTLLRENTLLQQEITQGRSGLEATAIINQILASASRNVDGAEDFNEEYINRIDRLLRNQ